MDLILIDLRLPVLDAFEAICLIREDSLKVVEKRDFGLNPTVDKSIKLHLACDTVIASTCAGWLWLKWCPDAEALSVSIGQQKFQRTNFLKPDPFCLALSERRSSTPPVYKLFYGQFPSFKSRFINAPVGVALKTPLATPQIEPIRVLLIDDQAVVRSGLRMLIESRPGIKVTGEAGNRADALDIASREQPDVIVLDLNLGNDNGLSLLPELLGVAKNSHIIVLSGGADAEKRDQTMELGAKGVVLKEDGAGELLNAIEKVYRTGDYWLEPGAVKRIFNRNTLRALKPPLDPESAKIAALTEREREVVALVGEGLKNKQIASRLFIHHTTVSHHLTSIFDKLGVSDRFELIIYAYRHRLAKPPL